MILSTREKGPGWPYNAPEAQGAQSGVQAQKIKMQGNAMALQWVGTLDVGADVDSGVCFANEAPDLPPLGADELYLVPLANALESTAANLNRLVMPFGEVWNDPGQALQRFTAESAKKIVQRFHSKRGQLARGFKGLPVYIGHPDHAAFMNQHKDTRAYGWVTGMRVTAEGLVQDVEWTAAGEELVANEAYGWFSPNLLAKTIGTANGRRVVEPIWIQSNGLTNNPNWPVYALGNESGAKAPTTQEESTMLNWLRTLFGKPEATEPELQALVNEQKVKAEAAEQHETLLANERTAKVGLETRLGSITQERDTFKAQADTEKATREQAETNFANERKARVCLMVDNALAAGKILPADKETWINSLMADFANQALALASSDASMKTGGARTADRTPGEGAPEQAASVQIQALVNERMATAKEPYHAAYLHVKRGNPDLFKGSAQA